MPQTDLGPHRWSILAARREDDLWSGLVRQCERPGLARDVLGQAGWQLIYEDRKHYWCRPSPTTVQVYANQEGTHVVKLDDRGVLIDQAASLALLKQEFGVRIPDDLVLVTSGDTSLLLMEKLDFVSGYRIRKLFKGREGAPPVPEGVSADEFRSLYEQGKTIAKCCTEYLVARPFDVIGLHRGNWGVTAQTFAAWREGKVLTADQVVIFDPVSMRYDHPADSAAP